MRLEKRPLTENYYWTMFDVSAKNNELVGWAGDDFTNIYQDLVLYKKNAIYKLKGMKKFTTFNYKVPPFVIGDSNLVALNYVGMFSKGFFIFDIEKEEIIENIKGYAVVGISPSGRYGFLVKNNTVFSIYDFRKKEHHYHSLKELHLNTKERELYIPQTAAAWNWDESQLAFCVESEVLEESRLYIKHKNGSFEWIKILDPDKKYYKDTYKAFFSKKDSSFYVFAITNYLFLRNKNNRVFSLFNYHAGKQQKVAEKMHFFPDGNFKNLISPDGTKIVLIGSPYQRVEKVYFLKPEELKKEEVCTFCIDGVANTLQKSANELYVLNLEDNSLQQLTDNGNYKRCPQFSKNNEILYLEKGKVKRIVLE